LQAPKLMLEILTYRLYSATLLKNQLIPLSFKIGVYYAVL
jgi:hypothetical protein